MTNYEKNSDLRGHPMLDQFRSVLTQRSANNGVLNKSDLSLSVADSTNMELAVSSGDVWFNGQKYTYGGTSTLSVSSNNTSYDRWDLVVFDTSTTSAKVKEGTAEQNPQPKEAASDELILGIVYLPDNTTSLSSTVTKSINGESVQVNQVIDLRQRAAIASEIYSSSESADLNNAYVSKSGDTMSGNLDIGTNTLSAGKIDAGSGPLQLASTDSASSLTLDLAGPIENFQKSQFQGLTLDVLSSDPSGSRTGFEAVAEGQVYYNSSNSKIKYYDGSSWIKVAEESQLKDTRTNISDSGTQILTDVTDINFASNLSVVDDGDGSVTVDSTDTDTTVDVSEDGTTVVSQVTDINFTTNVDVVDDADGTVTVSTTDTNTQTNVSDSGTQVLTNVGDINFASNLSVTDDGDGTVTVDASGGSGKWVEVDSNTISPDGYTDLKDVDEIFHSSNAILIESQAGNTTSINLDGSFGGIIKTLDSTNSATTTEEYDSTNSIIKYTSNKETKFIFGDSNTSGTQILTIESDDAESSIIIDAAFAGVIETYDKSAGADMVRKWDSGNSRVKHQVRNEYKMIFGDSSTSGTQIYTLESDDGEAALKIDAGFAGVIETYDKSAGANMVRQWDSGNSRINMDFSKNAHVITRGSRMNLRDSNNNAELAVDGGNGMVAAISGTLKVNTQTRSSAANFEGALTSDGGVLYYYDGSAWVQIS